MVTAENSRVDLGALRDMYRESEVAQAIFDHFATRVKNSTVTKTDRMINVLYNLAGAADRKDVIQFFRGLEEAGCGEYVEGRRGHPSRFVWSVQMATVGLAAAGKPAKVEQISDEEEEATDVGDDVGHTFRLRPNKNVVLTLPNDLTPQEAQRLADFVKTLPLTA